MEQLRGDFKVFGEALGGLRQHVTEEISGLRQEIGGLREEMNDRFERVEHELGEVRRDLGKVKVDLALVKSAVTTHTRELREIRSALGN